MSSERTPITWKQAQDLAKQIMHEAEAGRRAEVEEEMISAADYDQVVQRQRCEINTLYNKIEGKDARIARLEKLAEKDHRMIEGLVDSCAKAEAELRKHMEQEAPREQ